MRNSSFLTIALAAAVCVTPVAIGTALAAPSAATTTPTYGGIWTVDSSANAIREYAPAAHGAAAATTVISGAATGLDAPSGVVVGSAGVVYVANAGNNSITEYAQTATGDAAPIRTIAGSTTGLQAPSSITLSNGLVWVTDPGTNTVEAFSATDSGNVLPAQTLAGSKTELDHPVSMVADPIEMVVLNAPTVGVPSITIYVPLFSNLSFGNIKPLGKVSGTATKLVSPTTLMASGDGDIWVNSTTQNSVTSLDAIFGGGGAPKPIKGANTGLNDPTGIATDAVGQLLVSNAGDHSVRVFGRGAGGDVAPVRTITGIGAGADSPSGVAVFGRAPGAPTGLRSKVHGHSVTLTWKAPAVTGGGLTTYSVVQGIDALSGSGSGSVTSVLSGGDAKPVETTKTTLTLHHLKDGRPYFYSVEAVNGFGAGPASFPVFVIVSVPPSAPLHVSAKAHSRAFTAHWKAPKSNGGRRITRYDVEYATCVPGAKHCAFSTRTVGGSHHHTVIAALSPTETYYVRVIAHNAAGDSRPSKPARVTTLA